MSDTSIAELIFQRRASSLSAKAMADVLSGLIWVLSDNGEEVIRTQREWLEHSNDPKRIEVALLMDDIFPYDSREKLVNVLSAIETRWPHLRDLCDDVIREWDMQHDTR
jgi:hypothetical protein